MHSGVFSTFGENSLYRFNAIHAFWVFMPLAWKVRRGHLVIGVSIHPSVMSSCLHKKCNNWSLGGDTVAKRGLYVHLMVAHPSYAPGGGAGQNVGLWDFAIFWLCCCRGHLCFTNTCLVCIVICICNSAAMEPYRVILIYSRWSPRSLCQSFLSQVISV